MLQSPVKGLDPTVVVGGPAAVLVAADAAFEPVHGSSRPLTVYSSESADANWGQKDDLGEPITQRRGVPRGARKPSTNAGERDPGAGYVSHRARVTCEFIESPALLWHSRDVVIAFFFLFGIVIGSFLNVCISRIPEGMSIVAPASRCPQCEQPIKAYDNVPLFGWLWLRGKCRSCAFPISPMYPLVELLTGLFFVACYLDFGFTQTTVKWLMLTCLIIVLTITDLRVRLLPDLVNWPGFVAGLFLSAVVPPDDGTVFFLSVNLFHRVPPTPLRGFLDGLIGAAFGSLLLWGAAKLYKVARGREGMGLGDVKMMAM